jgi:RHS repeat-associated protein
LAFVNSPAHAQTGPVPIPPIVSAPTTHKPATVDRDFSPALYRPTSAVFSYSGPPAPPAAKPHTGFVPGLSTEVVSQRTADIKVFQNPDGTKTARIFSGPVHYQDPSGAWQEIDTDLITSSLARFKTTANSIGTDFAASPSDPDLAKLTLDGSHSLGFGLDGVSPTPSPPIVVGPAITYPQVFPHADLQLTARADGLKEQIVLTSKEAPDTFVFPLDLQGLVPEIDQEGEVVYRDSSGAERARTPGGSMEDSHLDPHTGDGAISNGVSYALISYGAGLALKATLDRAWLDDPARIYPVKVDPSFTTANTSEDDTYVMSTFHADYASDALLKVGYDGSGHKARAFMHFDGLNALAGKNILDATLSAWESLAWSCSARPMDLYRVTQGWYGHTTMDFPGPTYGERIGGASFAMGYSGSCPAGWASFDVTGAVANWASGAWANYGVMFKASDEADSYGWKKFSSYNAGSNIPHIDVDYNTPPTMATPVSPSPGDGATVHTATPIFATTASDPDGDQVYYDYPVCIDAAMTTCVWESGWTTSSSVTVPAGYLAWNATYYWKALTTDDYNVTYSTWTRSFHTANSPPPVPALASPPDASVTTTATPVLAATPVTDPDGDAVTYDFHLTTGADGGGLVVDSGWGGPTWTVPTGTVSDGRTYYWAVAAKDPTGDPSGYSSYSATRSLKVDQRLGIKPQLPYDTLGPVTVNLSNGNAVVETSSPSFKAVAGPIGLSYTYNSSKPSSRGLTGSYFNDNGNAVFDSYESPSLIRTDPAVNFDWGTGSPYPSIGNDHFLVRWTGYVSVPNTGSYSFGAVHDDGVRVWINNALVLDRWSVLDTSPVYATSTALVANTPTPVKVEYQEWAGPARMRLWASGPSGPGGAQAQAPVDPTWLSTDVPGLPDGWSFSADAAGDLSYTFARISDKAVVLIDASGATHSYTWTGTAWAPPPGEDGVLGTDAATGLLTLHSEDGRAYAFNPDGALASVSSTTDDTNPAAPTYTYAGTPARLSSITDPVSGRALTLTYGSVGTCPTAAGFTAAPAYMLCKVDYSAFNGGETDLYYSGGHLARISDPGGEVTDFGYDPSGKLTQIRDPLNNDLIASGVVTDPTSTTHMSLIAYTGDKATSVTAPIPDASGANRPSHSFEYQAAVTLVHTAGLNEPNGYTRRVALDNAGRALEEKDVAGKATTNTWDPSDHLVKTIDPANIATTHIYDAAGRQTDAYGPGAASEFTVTNTSATAPHSTTSYDEGINGLAASWWANKNMSGPPLRHSTSAVQQDWGAGSPDPAVPADNFSGRLTGEVNLPSTGVYTVTTTADAARLYVDDQKLIDTWGGPYKSSVTADAPSSWWRLGEASGTSAWDATAAIPATYSAGVTLGVTSTAVSGDSDTAASFDGAAGRVALPDNVVRASTTLTAEAWFKTTASGVVLGMADAAYPATPTQWVPVIYVGTDGKLRGQLWNGGVNPVTSGAAVNNGAWHHAVLTSAATTQSLYLDGALVGSLSGNADNLNMSANYTGAGYWAGSWPAAGSGWSFFNGSIDEAAVYPTALSAARVLAHYNAATSPNYASSAATSSLAAGAHRIRIDYQELKGNAQLKLNVSPPGTTLKPRYNLVTSQTDPDGKKTATEFATPYLGLPTANVLDPAGLSLRSTTSYEAAGAGYFRRTSKTLPKGSSTTVSYSYFGATETADNPCTAPVEAINQAGALKTETDADPDGAGPQTPIVHENRYDEAGRVVAQRVVGDAAWACTTYDSRGRVTTQKDSSGKTTAFDYSIPAQVGTSYTDSAGTARSTVAKTDWLARALSYTDENATITRTTYDQAGRATATYRTFSGQAESQLTALAYASATARLASITEYASGTGRTTSFTYDDAGKLLSATRPNGVVTTNTFDANRGWLNSISNIKNANELSPWTYTRNPSGKVASEATTGRTRNFTFDAAGRLTRTVEGATTRNYSFDADSNRCSTSTACDGSYSYNNADQITASPFATGYQYDPHGNLTSATPVKAPYTQSSSFSGSVGAGSASSQTISATATGTVTASLDWQAGTAVDSYPASVAALGQTDRSITASNNGTLSATLTWSPGVPNPNLDLYLLDPSGTEIASSKSLLGNSEQVTATVTGLVYPASATYTLRVKAVGLGSAFNLNTTFPETPNLDLELWSPSNVKVASSYSTNAKPETITYTVPSGGTGSYTLKAVSADYGSSYTLTTSYPRAYKETLSHTAGNFAQSVDDGQTATAETLSYSGRVLRRTVTDDVSGQVNEDTTFGYADNADSPAYSKPTLGGSVTTYVNGPDGLLVINTGTIPTYPIQNAHGDSVGVTDANGVFTANPPTDEWGVGTPPANRLGWLGGKERFSTGGTLNLYRFGVRLMDPSLGRFLERDPVEGGSANSYDYAYQDPINNFDLDGRFCIAGRSKGRGCRGAGFLRTVRRSVSERKWGMFALGVWETLDATGFGILGVAGIVMIPETYGASLSFGVGGLAASYVTFRYAVPHDFECWWKGRNREC